MPTKLPACERIVTSPPFRTWHQVHEWHELIVPIEGIYPVDVDGHPSLAGGPGTALFLPAGASHSPRVKVGDPVIFYCLMWAPSARWAPAPPVKLDDGDGHLLFLAGWMARLTRAGQTTPAGTRQKRLLVPPVEGAIDLARERGEAVRDERIAVAVAHLEGNLAEQNRVADLAAMVGMSVNGFIARFRAATGTTPGRHLQDLRLEQALALLAGTDLTLAEIAAQVGYTSASHLCQLVRKRTGRRASSFR